MIENQAETPDLKMRLVSPDNCLSKFRITVYPGIDKRSLCFEVSEGTHISKTMYYQLSARDHSSYLDLFEKLAEDYGLRTPLNRQASKSAASPQTNFEEQLTENVHADILYGYGDPAVLRTDKEGIPNYYLLATSNDAPNSFPILHSTDLRNWKLIDFVFPEGKKPDWVQDGWTISDFWAPELHYVGGNYKVYYVARNKETGELCIGMAFADQPEGPYTSVPYPILSGNVIDPHIFVENDDTVYLLWKEDNNDRWPQILLDLLYQHPEFIPVVFPEKADQLTACFAVTIWPWAKTLNPMEKFQVLQVLIEAVISDFAGFDSRLGDLALSEDPKTLQEVELLRTFMKTPMFAQRLSSDGIQLIGEKTKILENDLPWEAHLVEGMWLTKQQDHYYLFYAGNDFSTEHYGIGVAIADSPTGPFKKMSLPLLQSTDKWTAPGHPSVVTNPSGESTMFFHAYFPGEAGYKKFRALLSVPLTFEKNTVLIRR